MKTGDKVTGVPVGDLRKRLPTVTGYYDETEVKHLDGSWIRESIMVGKVSLDCEGIVIANRRAKETREEEVYG